MKTFLQYLAVIAVVLVFGEFVGQSMLHAVTFQPAPVAKQAPLAAKIDADIYLTGSNTVLFDQVIVPQTADTFYKALIGQRVILGPTKQLYVLIASPGGYAEVGERISQYLSMMDNITLICRFCASDAGFIFALYKGPRVVTEDSQFIMHEMFLDHVTGEMLKNQLDIAGFIQRSDDFNKKLYSVIGISKKEYEQHIIKKEWELTGTEIAKNHLADRVVKIACDPYMKNLAPVSCGMEGP